MIAMAILVEIIAIQLFPKIVQPKGEAGISTLCLLCQQMEDLNQDTIKMKNKVVESTYFSQSSVK